MIQDLGPGGRLASSVDCGKQNFIVAPPSTDYQVNSSVAIVQQHDTCMQVVVM